tara:strand:- start:200 stop:811 length:612 start_codon:yes stop_codon:yes gene_type:complete
MNIKLALINKVKSFIFIILFFPSLYWSVKLYLGEMGVNPIETTVRALGEFSLRLLILTLLITPLSYIRGLSNIKVLRRMIGLFAFYYICLHLCSYIILDHFFNWKYILKDIYKRPFITLGFAAFIFSIPLAITSNNIFVKKFTYKVWKKIHRFIYLIAPLAGLHYYLLTKADKKEPLIYLIIIFLLLFFRLIIYLLKKESLPR